MESGSVPASGGPEKPGNDPPETDPELISEALKHNRACQDSLNAVVERIQDRLIANQMLQKSVKQLIKMSRDVYQRSKEVEGGVCTAGLDWPGRKKAMKKRTSYSRIFVGMDGSGPAENPDIERTASLHAALAKSTKERRWTDVDKAKLRKAVVQQVQERWTTELFARMHRNSQSPGTSQAQTTFGGGLAALRQRPVTHEDLIAVLPSLNWDRVHEVSELLDRTPEECRNCWMIDLSPGVNRGRWTSEEDKRLKALVGKHEGHDWEAVASELGTGRTPVACLQHYQQDLVQEPQENGSDWPSTPEAAQGSKPSAPRKVRALLPVRKQHWTEEENLRLQYAVAAFGTSSWVHVAEVVGTRTDPQCRERWVNVLDPTVDASPWTPEENARLQALVRQLGSGKWAQLAEEFNAGRTLKRTDDRIRKHYEALVGMKRIEPAPASPITPSNTDELQLAVVDPRIVALTNRRLAAQEREAKRKLTKPPPKPQSTVRKQQNNAPQKDSGEIRKTGKSRLSLTSPPVPTVKPGLTTLLKRLEANKVQPTYVGSMGKPAALIDGKPVHFMQRQIGTQVCSIQVPKPERHGTPPLPTNVTRTLIPLSPRTAKHKKQKQIVKFKKQKQSTPKPQLTNEERLARRREVDKKRRQAVQEQKKLQAEKDGTLVQETAASLLKREERQRNEEARRKKIEERNAKQSERQEKEKARLQTKKEKEEAREQRRREKQAQREEARKRKEANKAQDATNSEGNGSTKGRKAVRGSKTGAVSKGRANLKMKRKVQIGKEKKVEAKNSRREKASVGSMRATPSIVRRGRKRMKQEEDASEGQNDTRPSTRRKPVTRNEAVAERTNTDTTTARNSRKRRGQQDTKGPVKGTRATADETAVVESEKGGKTADNTPKTRKRQRQEIAGLEIRKQTEDRQSDDVEGMAEDGVAVLEADKNELATSKGGRKNGGAKKPLKGRGFQKEARAGRKKQTDEGPRPDKFLGRGGVRRSNLESNEGGKIGVQSRETRALRRSRRCLENGSVEDNERSTAVVETGDGEKGSDRESDKFDGAEQEQTDTEIMDKVDNGDHSLSREANQSEIGIAAKRPLPRQSRREKKQGDQMRGTEGLVKDKEATIAKAKSTEAAVGGETPLLSSGREPKRAEAPSSKRKRASDAHEQEAMLENQDAYKLGGTELRRSTRRSTQAK